jgi:hypothetical protein
MAYFKRNRGGWPAREKTIFDAPAMRLAARAIDRLHNAIMYIHNTVDSRDETPYGGLYDAVTGKGDRASSLALDALTNAMYQVNDEAQARNQAAKRREVSA